MRENINLNTRGGIFSLATPLMVKSNLQAPLEDELNQQKHGRTKIQVLKGKIVRRDLAHTSSSSFLRDDSSPFFEEHEIQDQPCKPHEIEDDDIPLEHTHLPSRS